MTEQKDTISFGGVEGRSNLNGRPIGELSHLRRSLLFAELSHAVYWEEDTVDKVAKHFGFEDAHFIDRDGAQAYVFEYEWDCVIACRGTQGNEWNDIKADLNAFMIIAETVGKVHKGFKTEVDDLWPEIEKVVENNTKPLWFTGHSLGAAMAQICAGRCAVADIPAMPTSVCTFGSPRVGNKRYINNVEVEHIRWVNNNDVVTRVPPPWMGYRHNGQEIYVDSNGKIRNLVKFARLKDRASGFWSGIFKGRVDHFADHLMGPYISAIQSAIGLEEG